MTCPLLGLAVAPIYVGGEAAAAVVEAGPSIPVRVEVSHADV